jgi:alkylation response protein AidB-like acyl-CoA dehydrogenase
MFDITVAPELEEIGYAIRSLVEDRLAFNLPLPDRTLSVPEHLRRALADMGLVSPVATQLGGGGIPDYLTWAVIAEELATGDASGEERFLWRTMWWPPLNRRSKIAAAAVSLVC